MYLSSEFTNTLIGDHNMWIIHGMRTICKWNHDSFRQNVLLGLTAFGGSINVWDMVHSNKDH